MSTAKPNGVREVTVGGDGRGFSSRLLSVDVFRGMLVAGMLLVPGTFHSLKLTYTAATSPIHTWIFTSVLLTHVRNETGVPSTSVMIARFRSGPTGTSGAECVTMEGMLRPTESAQGSQRVRTWS